jgi:cell division protein FtsQ
VSVRQRRVHTTGRDLVDLPLTPAAEETPFFRPKTRARARATRRGRISRLTLVLQISGAAVLAGAVIWMVYAQVTTSARLKVLRVEVQGNSRLSAGEVRELLGPAIGENILCVDIDQLRGRLAASPWVAAARVRRSLPHTLTVEIQERVPLALAELDRLYLMDGGGALIDIYGPRTAGFELPVVRGLRGLDGEARAVRAARAGALLDDLGDLAAEISEVEVEDSGDLRAVLRSGGEVLRLGSPPYRSRLSTFLQLRKELANRCPRAAYFDLRFSSRIVVMEPVTGSETPTDVAAGMREARSSSMEVVRY